MTSTKWSALVLLLAIFSVGTVGCTQRSAPTPSLDQFRHVGSIVHNDTQEGYRLSFQLMSSEEKRATLPNSQCAREYDAGPSHHMMLIVLSPTGAFVTDATVYFSVRKPDGSTRESLAVPMAGGYGVDVDMRAKGPYEVRAEIVIDGQKIVETFTYEGT